MYPFITEDTSGGFNAGEGLAIGLPVMLLVIGATLICILVFCLRKHLRKGKYIVQATCEH